MDKIRLDKALLNQISSRAKAQDMIKDGKISVNGRVITKASFLVGDEDDIIVTHTEDEFVSRGAFKLKGCIRYWSEYRWIYRCLPSVWS